MYHTVGRPIPDWAWSFLTVPYKIFENHLQWLVKAGYQTVDLYDLQAHVSGQKILSNPSVVLTFDDGYLDNWGYVGPLLSKYGLKGTVFANPEFVDPRDIVRPTIEDVWAGKIQEEDVPVRGFMSWPELKRLSDSGILSIQSHAMSHTWYPSGCKIVDFHHPGDGIYWLDWNEYIEEKPFYLRNPVNSNVTFGTPIYEHEQSLAAYKFNPPAEEVSELTGYVEQNGGLHFFDQLDWKEQLFEVSREIRQTSGNLGTLESEQEQEARYWYELTESKTVLESRLGKSLHFLCWPGGGYNQKSQAMALEIYSAVTLGSFDKSPMRNRCGEDAGLIRRIGVPCIEKGLKVHYFNGNYFVYVLDEFRGKKLARRRRQVLKLCKLIRIKCTELFSIEGK